MKTDETTYDTRIALQPETEVEQRLLSELFTRLANISKSASHPDYHGTEDAHYILDIDFEEYEELEPIEGAEAEIDEYGRIDPDPGSRALVVIHKSEQPPTEDEVSAAVQALAEGDDEGNEFTVDAVDLAEEIIESGPLNELDEERLRELASDAATVGIVDIDPEDEDSDLIVDLEAHVTEVEDRIDEKVEDLREQED